MSRNVRKCTFEYVRPVKILIRRRIRAVWSEPSLGIFWIAKDAKFLHADNEDLSDCADAHGRRYVFWRRGSDIDVFLVIFSVYRVLKRSTREPQCRRRRKSQCLCKWVFHTDHQRRGTIDRIGSCTHLFIVLTTGRVWHFFFFCS